MSGDRIATRLGATTFRLAWTLAWALGFASPSDLGAANAANSIVNFWISPIDAGPSAPLLYAAPGAEAELKIWARPAPGYKLTAFALNLVADEAGILSFEEVSVLNPVVNDMGTLRHQLAFDTASGLIADADGIRGFQGLTILPAENFPAGAGIGPTCGLDPNCGSGSGTASWHIATVRYQVENYGSTPLFLELATQGIWQSPAQAVQLDPPTNTAAVFGLANDGVHGWGAAANPDLRNMHIGAADAIVIAASADFNQNGFVEGADYLIWQRGFGSGNSLSTGDANDDDAVNAVDLDAWKFQFGTAQPVLGGALAAPEPQGATALAMALCGRLATRRRRRRTPTRRSISPDRSRHDSQTVG